MYKFQEEKNQLATSLIKKISTQHVPHRRISTQQLLRIKSVLQGEKQICNKFHEQNTPRNLFHKKLERNKFHEQKQFHEEKK